MYRSTRYSMKATDVRVMRGPLAGLEGILVRNNSSTRLSISIEMIRKSLLVSVCRHDVELLEYLSA